MQKDPVCGMEIDEKNRNTLTVAVSAMNYYFCSNDCRSKFLEGKTGKQRLA